MYQLKGGTVFLAVEPCSMKYLALVLLAALVTVECMPRPDGLGTPDLSVPTGSNGDDSVQPEANVGDDGEIEVKETKSEYRESNSDDSQSTAQEYEHTDADGANVSQSSETNRTHSESEKQKDTETKALKLGPQSGLKLSQGKSSTSEKQEENAESGKQSFKQSSGNDPNHQHTYESDSEYKNTNQSIDKHHEQSNDEFSVDPSTLQTHSKHENSTSDQHDEHQTSEGSSRTRQEDYDRDNNNVRHSGSASQSDFKNEASKSSSNSNSEVEESSNKNGETGVEDNDKTGVGNIDGLNSVTNVDLNNETESQIHVQSDDENTKSDVAIKSNQGSSGETGSQVDGKVEQKNDHKFRAYKYLNRLLDHERKHIGLFRGDDQNFNMESREWHEGESNNLYNYLMSLDQLIQNAKNVRRGQVNRRSPLHGSEPYLFSQPLNASDILVQRFGASPVSSPYDNANFILSNYKNLPLSGSGNYEKLQNIENTPYGSGKGRYGLGKSQTGITNLFERAKVKYQDIINLQLLDKEEQTRNEDEPKKRQDNSHGSKPTQRHVNRVYKIDPLLKKVIYSHTFDNILKTKPSSADINTALKTVFDKNRLKSLHSVPINKENNVKGFNTQLNENEIFGNTVGKAANKSEYEYETSYGPDKDISQVVINKVNLVSSNNNFDTNLYPENILQNTFLNTGFTLFENHIDNKKRDDFNETTHKRALSDPSKMLGNVTDNESKSIDPTNVHNSQITSYTNQTVIDKNNNETTQSNNILSSDYETSTIIDSENNLIKTENDYIYSPDVQITDLISKPQSMWSIEELLSIDPVNSSAQASSNGEIKSKTILEPDQETDNLSKNFETQVNESIAKIQQNEINKMISIDNTDSITDRKDVTTETNTDFSNEIGATISNINTSHEVNEELNDYDVSKRNINKSSSMINNPESSFSLPITNSSNIENSDMNIPESKDIINISNIETTKSSVNDNDDLFITINKRGLEETDYDDSVTIYPYNLDSELKTKSNDDIKNKLNITVLVNESIADALYELTSSTPATYFSESIGINNSSDLANILNQHIASNVNNSGDSKFDTAFGDILTTTENEYSVFEKLNYSSQSPGTLFARSVIENDEEYDFENKMQINNDTYYTTITDYDKTFLVKPLNISIYNISIYNTNTGNESNNIKLTELNINSTDINNIIESTTNSLDTSVVETNLEANVNSDVQNIDSTMVKFDYATVESTDFPISEVSSSTNDTMEPIIESDTKSEPITSNILTDLTVNNTESNKIQPLDSVIAENKSNEVSAPNVITVTSKSVMDEQTLEVQKNAGNSDYTSITGDDSTGTTNFNTINETKGNGPMGDSDKTKAVAILKAAKSESLDKSEDSVESNTTVINYDKPETVVRPDKFVTSIISDKENEETKTVIEEPTSKSDESSRSVSAESMLFLSGLDAMNADYWASTSAEGNV